LTQYGKGGSTGGGAAAPTVVGQGGNGGNDKRGFGGEGAVIIAYQIGMSTTREIAQAQAEQEARAAGVEQGIEQGKEEGYAQAQEDLNDAIEAGLTALQAAVETRDTTIIDDKEQSVKRRRRK